MSSGYHAADDGSLARSTGGAAARGAMLIALALAIGLLLMWRALDDPATAVTVTDADAVATDTDADAAATDDAASDATAADDAAATDDTGGVTAVDPGDGTTATEPEQIPEETDPAVTEPVPGEFVQPSEVNVLVANGIGGAGVAGGTADKLIADGYLANAANAPATAEGVIFYRPGYDANARAVAEILGAAPDVVQPAPDTVGVAAEAINDGRLAEANIIVIIGADNAVPAPA